jgi:hypothetical protein
MKTEIVKKESSRNFLLERDLFGMKIPTRTKDGCYDLNEMLSEYNKHNPNKQKYLTNFFKSEYTQTYINNLMNIRYAELSGNMQLLDNQVSNLSEVPVNQLVTNSTKNFKVSVKIDKAEKIILQKTKGKTQSNGKKTKDTVFADSLLMKKFARWLNPMYEVVVDKWIEDDLIKLRMDLADSYNEWRSLVSKLGGKVDKENNINDYSNIQKCMNYAVFGYHEDGIRDTATIEQMRKMLEYEKMFVQMYEFGVLKTLDDLRTHLKKLWEKNYPTPDIFKSIQN